MRSIQTRLASGLIVSLIIFLIVQWLLIGTSIRYLSEAYVATRLEHDAQALLNALDFSVQPVALNTVVIDPIYKQPFSGHYYAIKTHGVEFRSRSLWDTDLPVLEVGLGKSQTTRSLGPQDQQLLIFHATYKKDQDLIFVSVAEDLTDILKDIGTFQFQHSIISIAILSVLVLIQAYIVKINLKPLDSVRREIENLEKGVINQLNQDVPTELYPLVKELNRQLIAIKKRLERSRNATGNLAHTLKTPLTLITQIANSDELKQSPQIKQSLLHHCDAIQQSIERELKRARMAGGNIVGSQTFLLREVNDLVNTLSSMYRQKKLAIDINIPQEVYCDMDRQDMLEVLGNVLENAFKWANKQIRIAVEQSDRIVITIEDDGPGHKSEDMEKLVSRGVRADEQVAGHGLGLSIVSEILNEYEGQLEFSRSPEFGGLRVQIFLPKS